MSWRLCNQQVAGTQSTRCVTRLSQFLLGCGVRRGHTFELQPAERVSESCLENLLCVVSIMFDENLS